MALKDQLIYGIHVGLVVESIDPDGLGRVKVLIPGKLGSVYTGWNDLETDITFSSATSDVFDQEKLERIKKVIPWARPAMPLWGGGTGSFNETTTGAPYVNPPEAAFNNNGGGGSANLTGENGKLNPNDPNQLVKVGNEYLNPIFAGKLQELQAAAAKDGISFTIQEGQGYRNGPLQAQYYANWKHQNITYEGVTYSPQKRGGIAAPPGASNHGWGNAVDIQETKPTSRDELVNWLWSSGNAINLGFTNYKGQAAYPTADQLHVQIARNDIGKYASYSVTKPTTTLNAEQSKELQAALAQGNGTGSTAYNAIIDNRKAFIDAIATTDGKGRGEVPVGTASGSDSKLLTQDSKGKVNRTELYNSLLSQIKSNPNSIYNNGKTPQNGEKYGLDGTAESWADFYSKLAGFESGYFANSPFINEINGIPEPDGSGGLFQLGRNQIQNWIKVNPDLARSYGLDPNRNYTEQELLNPDLSTTGMLFVGDAMLNSPNYGFGVGPDAYGLGKGKGRPGTIGELSWKRIASGENPGEGATDGNRRIVHRPTNQGVSAFGNANTSRPGSPNGMFSIPMVGAKVWVMFEGGSPQRPVYIAQAYDPSNIQAYDPSSSNPTT